MTLNELQKKGVDLKNVFGVLTRRKRNELNG